MVHTNGNVILAMARAVTTLHEQLVEGLGAYRLTLRKVQVLRIISSDRGAISVTDLAKRLGITKQCMSRVVQELDEDLMIETIRPLGKRHCMEIYITAYGQAQLDMALWYLSDLESKYFGGVPQSVQDWLEHRLTRFFAPAWTPDF